MLIDIIKPYPITYSFMLLGLVFTHISWPCWPIKFCFFNYFYFFFSSFRSSFFYFLFTSSFYSAIKILCRIIIGILSWILALVNGFIFLNALPNFNSALEKFPVTYIDSAYFFNSSNWSIQLFTSSIFPYSLSLFSSASSESSSYLAYFCSSIKSFPILVLDFYNPDSDIGLNYFYKLVFLLTTLL